MVVATTLGLRHCPYAEKTTSELRKDRTFPTLFLAKTLILRLAVSVLVQKKDPCGQNTNIRPKTSDPPSVVGLVVGPPPET